MNEVLDDGDAVGVLHADEVLADQRRVAAVGDHRAVEIVGVDVELAVVELAARRREGGERRVLAVHAGVRDGLLDERLDVGLRGGRGRRGTGLGRDFGAPQIAPRAHHVALAVAARDELVVRRLEKQPLLAGCLVDVLLPAAALGEGAGHDLVAERLAGGVRLARHALAADGGVRSGHQRHAGVIHKGVEIRVRRVRVGRLPGVDGRERRRRVLVEGGAGAVDQARHLPLADW